MSFLAKEARIMECGSTSSKEADGCELGAPLMSPRTAMHDSPLYYRRLPCSKRLHWEQSECQVPIVSVAGLETVGNPLIL